MLLLRGAQREPHRAGRVPARVLDGAARGRAPALEQLEPRRELARAVLRLAQLGLARVQLRLQRLRLRGAALRGARLKKYDRNTRIAYRQKN